MTMATYIVKPGQNIWDIALQLHGGVDGLFDLLVSNQSINMSTEFVGGEVLEYHDFFIANQSVVASLKDASIVPSNGNRGIVVKNLKSKPSVVFNLEKGALFASFQASGRGFVTIDWGDGSEDDIVQLNSSNQIVEHYFSDRYDGRRMVRFLGEFEFYDLDITRMAAIVYATRIIHANKILAKRSTLLDGFRLFSSTKSLVLDESVIVDLSPIAKIPLTSLSLMNCFFEQDDALEKYLEAIIEDYGDRPPCTIRMSVDVSAGALEKINTILNEPSWNIRESWKFIAGDKIYTNSNE